MRQKDVRFGRATVVVDERGGWALPGGGRTDQRVEAMAAAAEIDRMLARGAEVTPEVVQQPVVVVRRPAKSASVILSRT